MKTLPSRQAGDYASDENIDRILRMFARFTSVGYVAYLAILLPDISFLAPHLDSWWTPTITVLVFGLGLLPGALSFLSDTRLMRAGAAAAAIMFLFAAASWPLAWNGPDLPADDGVWLASFPGLASLAAVICWPTTVVFAHLVVGCVAVQLINFVAREESPPAMLIPEIAFAIMFCTLFVGGAVMAKRTGLLLDSTTEATHTAAAVAAAQRARTVERERFDGLIHDSVMSTFLAAARGHPQDLVSPLAKATLAELDDLRSGAESSALFTVEDAIIHLRSAASDADDQAAFAVTRASPFTQQDLPSEGVRAMSSAMAEALRNSHLHAGAGATRTVGVTFADRAVCVDVTDNGVGFDRSAVPPHRLGVTVSILGRMDRLPGGSARIDTAPGVGTRVHLHWDVQ